MFGHLIMLHIFLKICIPNFKEIHSAWSHKHTQLVMHFKSKVNSLRWLGIPNSYAFIIDALDNSPSKIRGLKQCLNPNLELLARFHSRVWTRPQIHYSTLKRKFLSIQNLVSKQIFSCLFSVFNSRFIKKIIPFLTSSLKNSFKKNNFVSILLFQMSSTSKATHIQNPNISKIFKNPSCFISEIMLINFDSLHSKDLDIMNMPFSSTMINGFQIQGLPFLHIQKYSNFTKLFYKNSMVT